MTDITQTSRVAQVIKAARQVILDYHDSYDAEYVDEMWKGSYHIDQGVLNDLDYALKALDRTHTPEYNEP
jgi:hypothetical protein